MQVPCNSIHWFKTWTQFVVNHNVQHHWMSILSWVIDCSWVFDTHTHSSDTVKRGNLASLWRIFMTFLSCHPVNFLKFQLNWVMTEGKKKKKKGFSLTSQTSCDRWVSVNSAAAWVAGINTEEDSRRNPRWDADAHCERPARSSNWLKCHVRHSKRWPSCCTASSSI